MNYIMYTKCECCVSGNLVVVVDIARFGLDNYVLVDVYVWYVHFEFVVLILNALLHEIQFLICIFVEVDLACIHFFY
jgi:hypothetical protein